MKKLLIVESPGKTGKLQQILGGEWTVAASVGHICDLPTRELGLEGPDLAPKYALTERGKGVVQRLKALAEQCAEIYLATDPDREGEAIAYHIARTLKLRNPKRCTFNEINAGPVNAAVRAPRAIDMNLVAAQEARRGLDRLVGYLVSPKLSDRHGMRLSAGRVQSPAVRLVVDRDREIRGFNPTNHFGVIANLGGWTAEWDTSVQYPDDPHYCMERAVAEAMTTIREFKVEQFEQKDRRVGPHGAFTTSALQQETSVRLKISPADTMQIAQRLYERGLITYHRTDNPNISEDGFKEIQAFGAANNLSMSVTRRMFKSSGNAQEAHEAIRPTDIALEADPELIGIDEKVYRLIRIRSLASQMTDAIYNVTTARLQAPNSDQTARFVGKAEVISQGGWLELWNAMEDRDGEEAQGHIPELSVGTVVKVVESRIVNKKTKAPKRFTEASLIKELERCGIGRPATYAAIMTKIISSGYVEVDRKQLLRATAVGETLVDALVGRMTFIELDFTRDMEKALDQVACGKRKYSDVVTGTKETLEKELGISSAVAAVHAKTGAAPVFTCKRCNSALTRKVRAGHFDFWGCTAYPSCTESYSNRNNMPDYEGQRKGGSRTNDRRVREPRRTSER